MEELYRKRGRRYVPVGREFSGFLSDGIWLVQNGTNSQTCFIGMKENVPLYSLPYRMFAEELSIHLVGFFKQPHSWYDVAVECADFFAKKYEETNE